MKEKVTPCLTHSLNNELGIPSACEYDPIAALSMQLLDCASGCASFMGEVNPMEYQKDFVAEGLEGVEDRTNLYSIFHSVGNRKMHGFDKPDSAYGIQLDFGSHVPLAYVDHTEVLKMFAEAVGLEAVMA